MLVVRWSEVLWSEWLDFFMALNITGRMVRRVFKFRADV